MEDRGYGGLTGAEVKKRVDKGQVNTSDSHISKTTAEIVRCHTLTYFNFQLSVFFRN